MTRARDIANLVDANGDIVAGALDNVPASNDASALTTGTLDAARLPTEIVSSDTTPQLGGNLDGQTNDITNVGNIGIGTASPSQKLMVQGTGGADGDVRAQIHNSGSGTSDDSILRLSIGGTSASNYFQFGDSADANAGQIQYNHSDDSMRFNTNAVERMRLDNAGRVAIGDTTASTHLHLNVTGTGSRRLRVQNSEGSADFGSDANRALIWVAGNQKLRIDAGGAVYLNSEGGNLSTGVNVQSGSAKAWSALEQSGTHSHRDSYNMSTISDLGTGISRLNIGNNMNNANYATTGQSGEQSGGGNRCVGTRGSSQAPSTGSFDIANFNLNNGSSDDTRISLAVLGDLA